MRAENGAYLGHYKVPEPRCEICGWWDCECWHSETCGEAFEVPHEYCAVCRKRKDDCGCTGDLAPGISAVCTDTRRTGRQPSRLLGTKSKNNSLP